MLFNVSHAYNQNVIHLCMVSVADHELKSSKFGLISVPTW